MLTGIGEEITIGDTKYRLPAMERRDWALVKERLLSLRADPAAVVERLAPGAPPEVAKALYEKAYEDAVRGKLVSGQDFDDFVYSLEGQQLCFWLRIHRRHPEMTEKEAAKLQEQWCTEAFAELTAALMKRFPNASQEEIEKRQRQQEDVESVELTARGLGLPEGNSPTPETPGTPTSPSIGVPGTPN
jgi:hypothetical protein